MRSPTYILPLIVFAQFCCTSLWFASNAILPQLATVFELPDGAAGHLTAMVQFGFITGTLLFALGTVSDRFSPSNVFFLCSLLGAAANLGMLWQANTYISLLLIRFITGFFLAGIYPVGMKIAADYYDKGLGRSLGYLVGALVLGTGFPHLLAAFFEVLSWTWVVGITALVAAFGGLLIRVFVPDGPYRQAANTFNFNGISQIFANKSFRRAAFGYFGHMWELYAFWAFVPVLLTVYNKINANSEIQVSLWSFIIIGIGSLGCVLAGILSLRFGSKRIATIALLLSGIFCVVSPLFFTVSPLMFLTILLCWGFVVIADSPMFSTLVAQNTTSKLKGTALTIVNCIGFAVTIVSIELLSYLTTIMDTEYVFVFLAIGPFLGLLALLKGNSENKIIITKS